MLGLPVPNHSALSRIHNAIQAEILAVIAVVLRILDYGGAIIEKITVTRGIGTAQNPVELAAACADILCSGTVIIACNCNVGSGRWIDVQGVDVGNDATAQNAAGALGRIGKIAS